MAWPPDGKMLAFYSNRGGDFDIWSIPAAGGTAVQLTTDGAFDGFPVWSPDGAAIAFESDRDLSTDVWVTADVPIFCDGFESGDTSMWSASVP